VIVGPDELARLAGSVTMVDGGFDPLHDGHVRYFAAAAALGLPVLCNASPDSWVDMKHAPLLPQDRRAVVLDALRDIAYVHVSSVSTVEVLEALRPRHYAKGEDWRGRLPEPERDVCLRLGIEVVYLDTITSSSTTLLERFLQRSEARCGS
jgi:bifunctional ADP-heptose synthase (sugar kinase/adenylyltransferase)